jgi:hypothetical protein
MSSAEQFEHMEQTVAGITAEERQGSLALWFAVFGSPLAWGGHLIFGYVLEEWFACSPSATDRGKLLGLSVDQASIGFNSLMAAIAAAAGLTGLACWRRLRHATDGDTLDRSRWMAFAGAVEGAIFLPMILLGYLPPLVLGTCAISA